MAEYLNWKPAPAGGGSMKDLEQFLLDRAMEHDSQTLLFTVAAEYLISVGAPADSTLTTRRPAPTTPTQPQPPHRPQSRPRSWSGQCRGSALASLTSALRAYESVQSIRGLPGVL